jgi:nucleotide-binding universal stress UspA family protein
MPGRPDGRADTAGQGQIVVGVDGSEAGRRALQWALDEARMRRAECLLVHAWSVGVDEVGLYPGEVLPLVAQDAQWLLDTELDVAAASGVPAKGLLVEGSAADALVEASADADLLVVGHRRQREAPTAVRGSVSAACVDRSACPVVVVALPA